MKEKRRLIYKLFPSYLLITLLSLIAVSWYALTFTRQFFLERTRVDLEVSGRLIENQVIRMLSAPDEDAVDTLCKEAAGQTPIRVSVILPDGRVVGDSEEIPANMDNHGNRDEIRTAIGGDVGVSIRFSDTIRQRMMYVALPLQTGRQLAGVLRMSLPVNAIDERIGVVRWRIAFGALLTACLASGVSWFVSRRITAPIERMREGARRFAKGDLFHRLNAPDTYEYATLATSMNQMAQQLQQRIDEINNQRSKTEAILSSMREGVIATDLEQQVISINHTAAVMFNVPLETAFGRSILEIIRNHEFHELMDRSMSKGEGLESDIVYHKDGERTYNVHCAPLLDPLKEKIGGLVVISDVTQLRRLENMRRDFAASVSHEIKTPLTAIKGFVETLVTGTLDDAEETGRFLKIIDKHVNRLAAILDDLMQLSRIEGDHEVQQIGMEMCRIEDVLNTAVSLCNGASREKEIAVQIDCEPELSGRFDATLLEQAAVNLLDNALKYSPKSSVIRIEALTVGDEIQIRFKDQ
ncbi:MAG TPA: histidine kinase dimerization/phospho-acceptor domain-containing protein, partial [Desulfosarcina sp.]|nr:histidine kinase dimerization/phospho-acceptor domain-containing protein [Desulfosarcina sp.]